MSELKEQRYIIEIAKVQGVAKAAENLFISQPALSKFLTRTEEMYGVQLFERIGKKMIPTYAGKQYLEYAKQIVKLDQDFRNQIADIKMLKKGSLNIGSTSGRGKRILPEILPIFSKEYPEYDLNVYQETAVKLEEMLHNGEIQVALMTGTEELEKDSNFHVEEISTEEICLIAPKSKHFHGIAKYGFRYPWIDIRQMENEKFIMLNKGSRLRYVTDKVLKNHSMDPKQIEFSSIETIWELVSKDFGVALASDFQYPKNLDVDVFSICSKPVTWKFVIVTRVGGCISVPVQRIIEIAKNIYRD